LTLPPLPPKPYAPYGGAPATRSLPAVLRDALQGVQGITMIVGTFAAPLTPSDPDRYSAVNVTVGGTTIKVPALAGIVGVQGKPCYILVTKDFLLAIGTIGDQSAGAVGIPIGGIVPFAGGGTIPANYLLCDGALRQTALYPLLFSVIGYAWGGSGANFNVPDLRQRVPVGSGPNMGLASSDGQAVGNRSPSHHHAFSGSGSGSDSGSISIGEHQHPGVGDHQHPGVGGHTHWISGANYTVMTEGTAGGQRNVAESLGMNTDSQGAHQHGSAGGHQHGPAGGGSYGFNVNISVDISGDTSGGNPSDAPSYVVLHQLIRAF
jgi:microcystin-dependent protein